MSYKIIWDKKPKEILQKLEPIISLRIYKKIDELIENPFFKIKKLKGIDAFSLRIGNYRVILSVDVNKEIICILNIGHIKNIYKNL